MRAELQRQILLQALSDVPFDGFTDAVVKRASEKFGVSDDEMKATFPNGPASLVENFSEMCDGEIARAMAGSNITSVRQKVTRAMRARLEAMAPHKHAARKAASFLMRPQHAALGARLLARTADAIWREVGDRDRKSTRLNSSH